MSPVVQLANIKLKIKTAIVQALFAPQALCIKFSKNVAMHSFEEVIRFR